jgi:hypothetical protein
MKSKKNKTFDCIAMKRAAQEKIREQVRGMTRAEEVAFFREGHEEFDRQVQAAKQQRLASRSPEEI